MSVHVLLNLLYKLGKRDKMRGLLSILSLFRNEFNKFNNTRARMLDSIYHMTNTLKSHFWHKNVIILSLCTQRCYVRNNVSRKSISTCGLLILLHCIISLPDATSYDKIKFSPLIRFWYYIGKQRIFREYSEIMYFVSGSYSRDDFRQGNRSGSTGSQTSHKYLEVSKMLAY